MKEILNRFFLFVKNPDETSERYQTASYKFRTLFVLFLATTPLIFIFMAAFEDMFSKMGNNAVEELLKKHSKLFIIFTAVLFGPLFEELIFRFPLKFKRNFVFQFFWWLINTFNFNKFKGYLLQNRVLIFKIFFYIIAILFGLIHISNFDKWRQFLYLAPIIVFPQILAGIILGYIRIKFGFFWGVFYHSCYNFILLSPYIIGNYSI